MEGTSTVSTKLESLRRPVFPRQDFQKHLAIHRLAGRNRNARRKQNIRTQVPRQSHGGMLPSSYSHRSLPANAAVRKARNQTPRKDNNSRQVKATPLDGLGGRRQPVETELEHFPTGFEAFRERERRRWAGPGLDWAVLASARMQTGPMPPAIKQPDEHGSGRFKWTFCP